MMHTWELKKKKKSTKLWDVRGKTQIILKMNQKKKKKKDDTIQESSKEFTPFRRAVCDWLVQEESRKLMFFRIGRDRAELSGQGLRDIPLGRLEKVSSLCAANQGGFWVA